MLLDEPFGALDPLTRDALAGLPRAARAPRLTAIFVTHDMAEALLLGDRIAVLDAGRLVQSARRRALAPATRRSVTIVAHAASPGRGPWARWSGPHERRSSPSALSELLAQLPDYLGSHLRVSIAALALGARGQPAAGHRVARPPAAAQPLLGVAGIVQTIPGPGAAGAVLSAAAGAGGADDELVRHRVFRLRFPAGGAGADALFDAADTAQHNHRTERRRPGAHRGRARRRHDEAASAVRIELPLAAPVIMAGVRTACGLDDRHGDAVDAGRPDQPRQLHLRRPADRELGARGVRLRQRRGAGDRDRPDAGADRAAGSPGAAGLGSRAGCSASSRWCWRRSPLASSARQGYVVGAKNFSEQYILAELIAQRLEAAGLPAATREGLGSSVIFGALQAGEIDVYVDYSGTLWANELKRADQPSREKLLAELKAELQKSDITLLGPLGFENAYALMLPRQRAQALGIHSIADLAAHSASLSIAGDYEFFARPEWAALRQAYGWRFREQRTLQPDFMYAAVTSARST